MFVVNAYGVQDGDTGFVHWVDTRLVGVSAPLKRPPVGDGGRGIRISCAEEETEDAQQCPVS